MSSKKFDKKNAQTFKIVHRPHDDPRYYDSEASERMLLPLVTPNEKTKQKKQVVVSNSSTGPLKSNNPYVKLKSNKLEQTSVKRDITNKHIGEAALYGIEFDDSKYDYTQHLKPIGLNPESSVFVSKDGAKQTKASGNVEPVVIKPSKKDIAEMFTEDRYKEVEKLHSEPVFKFGRAKPEYLEHQIDIAEDLKGFKPDMDPALREILEALEDDAYVINDDIVVDQKKLGKITTSASNNPKDLEEITEEDEDKEKHGFDGGYDEDAEEFDEGDDDIFAELLGSGETGEGEEYQQDEWDMDNYEDEFDSYENETAQIDLAQFDGDLSKFNEIGWGSDMSKFIKEQGREENYDNESINDFGGSEFPEEDDDEGFDQLGALPSFSGKSGKTANRKQRRKKGAMSDTSGFSMSSSAIARTEVMTVLDDKYDQIIDSYQNYEDEQEDSDYEEFDMKKERPDLESMLDDFLDNYELGSGGRKLVKKSEEKDRYMKAADSVSKGKISMRRKREQELLEKKNKGSNYKNDVNSLRGITGGLNSLKF